jgi:hypothetical protein
MEKNADVWLIHDEGVQEERKCKLNEAICLVLILFFCLLMFAVLLMRIAVRILDGSLKWLS